ncbi:MAG: hypothetical protein ACI4KF_02265 [Huintestinicola sp.]
MLTGEIRQASGLSGGICGVKSLSAVIGVPSGEVNNDYDSLINKPRINGTVLAGDVDFEELGVHIMSDTEIAALFDTASEGTDEQDN